MPQTSQRGCPGVEVTTLCLRNFLVLVKLMLQTSQREHPAGAVNAWGPMSGGGTSGVAQRTG